jgi:uncharacterized membrane protein
MILIFAAGLRCWHLGSQSLWLDESFSLECSFGHDYAQLSLPRNVPISPAIAYTNVRDAKPWWTIPRSLDHDLHPPLAYMLLRGWTGIFGYSEAAIRSLSVVASLAGIALLFAVARRLHGDAPALWACLLMAVAQYQIEFAQEAKHYALLAALSLAILWIVLIAAERGATLLRCSALFVITLAAVFSHYYALEAVAVICLWIILQLRGNQRIRLLATIGIAVLIFVVAWSPVMRRQQRNLGHDADFLRDSNSHHVARSIERAAVIPPRLLSEPPPGWDRIAAVGGAIVCALPWFMLRRRNEFLIWGLWLPAVILPTLVIDLCSGTWALTLMRYSLLAGPAVYCILAASTARSKSISIRYSVPLIAVLSCVLAIPDAYHPKKADWRTFGRYLGNHVTAADVVVFGANDDPIYRPAVYLLCASHYAGPLPCSIVLLDRPADASVLASLRRYRRIILVTDANNAQEMIPGAVLQDAKFMPLMGSVLTLTLPSPLSGE